MTGTREAEELLLIEEADAWFEYLEATRAQSAVRYREVEPWAWARLQQRTRAIKARRDEAPPRGGVVAAWSPDFEPPDSRPHRARACRHTRQRLLQPTPHRNEIEQLARERAQAEAGAKRRRDLGQPLAASIAVRRPARAAGEPDLVEASAGRSTPGMNTAAPMIPFFLANSATSRSQTARRSTGTRAASGAPSSPRRTAITGAIASSGKPCPAPSRMTSVASTYGIGVVAGARQRRRRSARARGARA